MAGSRSVAEKLMIRPGDAVAIVPESSAAADLVAPMPANTTISSLDGATPVVLIFVEDEDDLTARFGAVAETASDARAIWFCYQKGGRSSVNRDSIIRRSSSFGWRAISNIAIDDTWSAVRVRPLRVDEAPLG